MQAASTQARRERNDDGNRRRQKPRHWSRSRCRVPRTRCRWRASTSGPHSAYHDLGDYAEDAETVTSELVTNAISTRAPRHSASNCMRLDGSGAVAVVVTDPCPLPPVKRDPAADAEHGRGLLIVEALSARWGWTPHDPGKAVFAIFTREG